MYERLRKMKKKNPIKNRCYYTHTKKKIDEIIFASQ